jgi:hypothetical protein
MEKNNKSKLGIMVAAFLAIAPGIAKADPAQQKEQEQYEQGKKNFIPIEELSPELRTQIFEKLRIISTLIKIDWETIIVGVDENGEVVLKAKSDTDLQVLGNPTCWKKE